MTPTYLEAEKRLSLSNRAPLENPMDRLTSLQSLKTTNADAIRLQMQALNDLQESILSDREMKLKETPTEDKLTQKDILDLKLKAADKGYQLVQKEDGTFDVVTTGEIPKTEKQKEQVQKLTDVAKTIDLLEKNLNEVEWRGRGPGDIGKLLSGLSGGKLFGETTDYEALRKSLIGPLARVISGEVGVLTDKDIARAEDLLPKVSDDKATALRKLANLREMIKEKGGKIDGGGDEVDSYLDKYLPSK